MDEKKPMPGIGTQAVNVLGAIGRVAGAVVAGEKVIAVDDVYKTRLVICKSCPDKLYDEASRRCSACGCQTEYKLKLNTEACPKGHWGPVASGSK